MHELAASMQTMKKNVLFLAVSSCLYKYVYVIYSYLKQYISISVEQI